MIKLALLAAAVWPNGQIEAASELAEKSVRYKFQDGRASTYTAEVSSFGGALFPGIGTETNEFEVSIAGMPDHKAWILNQLYIEVQPGFEADQLILGMNLKLVKDLEDGFYIFEAPDALSAAETSIELGLLAGVKSTGPIMRHTFVKTSGLAPYPSDPYFDEQFYLEHRDSNGKRTGIDLNVREAWKTTQGEGVSIAVVDDGIETTHPDLANQTKDQPHHNYVNNRSHAESTPPVFGFHGTNVAGLIAAEGYNNIGISGVAPKSSLTSLLIFGQRASDFASDSNLISLFRHEGSSVQVQNHSWASGTHTLSGPSTLVKNAIKRAATEDRNGLGIIMVRSAGNFRSTGVQHPGNGNVNDDQYPSSPYVIAVAASDKDGKATTYSSPGASVLVAAPSGDSENNSPNLLTTDLLGNEGANRSGNRSDYAFGSTGFNGTSASSPEVAGIAALILSVRPDLHYRDVQQILALSAKQYYDDPHSQLNGGGLVVNDNVGFGIPDAGKAVELAKEWESRPVLVEKEYQKSVLLSIGQDEFGLSIPLASEIEGLQTWIPGKPSLGPINDTKILTNPLTFVGLATSTINQDLSGRGALIERGEIFFRDKINRAAAAGAEFAIIFNNQNDSTLIMAETDYTPIPAIFIGKTQGESLKTAIIANPDLQVSLELKAKKASFQINDELLVEHVSLEISSDINRRKGVRLTLISPSGTKSELHSLNNDNISDLNNWTFYSTQHMFEPAKGTWSIQVSNVDAFESSGTVNQIKLGIRGVSIKDQDGDGLDDDWERDLLGNTTLDARDDPDGDGLPNGYEHLASSDPLKNDRPFKINVTIWKEGFLYLEWPGEDQLTYDILRSGSNLNQFGQIQSVNGIFPTSDAVIRMDIQDHQFFKIKTRNNQ